ncbi:unnamed protein product [Protopolystoma xenopodis]|uniref:Uncharacterized protein n=1 Tax=Protopolystoma xenopodis TaxID=117903 RepID=A0A448XKP0_9PLAT|nr:unnamed protein product [Protopolystoma xenopodis]
MLLTTRSHYPPSETLYTADANSRPAAAVSTFSCLTSASPTTFNSSPSSASSPANIYSAVHTHPEHSRPHASVRPIPSQQPNLHQYTTSNPLLQERPESNQPPQCGPLSPGDVKAIYTRVNKSAFCAGGVGPVGCSRPLANGNLTETEAAIKAGGSSIAVGSGERRQLNWADSIIQTRTQAQQASLPCGTTRGSLTPS